MKLEIEERYAERSERGRHRGGKIDTSSKLKTSHFLQSRNLEIGPFNAPFSTMHGFRQILDPAQQVTMREINSTYKFLPPLKSEQLKSQLFFVQLSIQIPGYPLSVAHMKSCACMRPQGQVNAGRQATGSPPQSVPNGFGRLKMEHALLAR